ncbi:MAG: sulfurtransferase FdhD, partial [Gammaproteobacteria bacterium]|nr:sulfurtransferase FdhD [Phycisphaerae bacterium]NIR92444.1 sulfurtransferase FdhD [Gammaproteobacteria bacterium]NIU11032.1 sulfurtransferase FdhD [Phycisphaerae bacterium]NIW95183.1 sulfurtransferase FdhD [Phycisphaerae bacterium]NIX26557.1 sulfurtransferase FdhD [Phycisphaerae bacterium]
MKIETLSYSTEELSPNRRQVVVEQLFSLAVNGRDLLSLVASPHQPEQLIIGFLYLQGFITSADDVDTLGICNDSGRVAVSVRGEVPERLRPTVTSGCGG